MTCWIGESSVQSARELFKSAHIPTYQAPGEAVEAFMRLAQHRRNQELLMETPPSIPEEFTPDTETARRIIQIALDRRSAPLERLRNQPDFERL